MTKSATAVALDPSRPEPVAQLVTNAELCELGRLEREFAAARRRHDDLERRTKAARLALAHKVLGVKSSDELSALDPETLEELMAVREEKGYWRAEKKAPPFVFLQTWSGRCPSWKDEFIKLKSEAEADQLTANTDKSYAYRVDIPL